jgi:hypothetical protein
MVCYGVKKIVQIRYGMLRGKSGYFNNSATHDTTERGSCKAGFNDSILYPADATKHNERFWRSGGLCLTILITDGYTPPP